jgi:hypothetical protein
LLRFEPHLPFDPPHGYKHEECGIFTVHQILQGELRYEILSLKIVTDVGMLEYVPDNVLAYPLEVGERERQSELGWLCCLNIADFVFGWKMNTSQGQSSSHTSQNISKS